MSKDHADFAEHIGSIEMELDNIGDTVTTTFSKEDNNLNIQLKNLNLSLAESQKDRQQLIKTIIFSDGTFILIDIGLLMKHAKNGRLVGAIGFNLLFNLIEDTSFKKVDMITDENGCISICKFFEISRREWFVFMEFLKFGRIKYDMEESSLVKISEIFGGIPSIDMYIGKNMLELDKKVHNYNPMTPVEDVKDLYDWHIQYISGVINPGFSATVIFGDGSNKFYYRKKKNSAIPSETANGNDADDGNDGVDGVDDDDGVDGDE